MRNITKLAIVGLALGGITSVNAQDQIDFEKEIYPMVKKSCVKCHLPEHEDERGRKRKPKGGHVMTTKVGLMESEGEEGEKFIVPGDSKKSRILQVTLLPIDDEMHFPPEGKADQWTKMQQALFAKWVDAGADFGSWTEDKNAIADIAAKK